MISSRMTTASYKLVRQIGGRGHYAQVSVQVTAAPDVEVSISPDIFAWDDFSSKPASPDGEYQDGAKAGVRYALANCVAEVEPVHVVVQEIRFLVVDTTPAAVAAAACWATWKALPDPGRNHPLIRGALSFPGGGMDLEPLENARPWHRHTAWRWVLVTVGLGALAALATWASLQ